jgi:hypothetical protein
MTSLAQVIIAHPDAIPNDIACGANHTIVLFKDTLNPNAAYVYACGSNTDGQLAINNNTAISSVLAPVYITDVISDYSANIMPIRIACGRYHTSILFVDTSLVRTPVYSSGLNSVGQLANDSTTSTTKLVQMSYTPTFDLSNTLILAVTGSRENTCILTQEGANNYMYNAGTNMFNQIGRSTQTTVNSHILPPDAGNIYSDIVNIFDTTPISPSDACFNEGTEILCFINEKEVYVPIQNIRNGFLIKTYIHGYIEVDLIGKKSMINNPSDDNCMYIMHKTNNMTNDLIITKNHAILVDKITDDEKEAQKQFDIIDGKYLLLASKTSKFEKIRDRKIYTYYHLVLKDDKDIDGIRRFGIYANGVLTESISKRVFMRMKFSLL